MSEIDEVNKLTTQVARGVPHASAVTGVWKALNGYTVQVEQNCGFWAIYDGSAWAVQRGRGSAALADAMRRVGMIV